MDFNRELMGIIDRAIEARLGDYRSREDAMVAMHGEAVTFKRAAELLNVTPKTISNMVADGRLQGADRLVSVRSIADWMVQGSPNAHLHKRRKEAWSELSHSFCS